jgi:hypothetical protein
MNQKHIFRKGLPLKLFFMIIFILKSNLVCAEQDKQTILVERALTQVQKPSEGFVASFYGYIDKLFISSMLIIIPDTKGSVYFSKTINFVSDSTKFLNQNRPIKLNKLSSVLLEETKGDINKAYYLLIIAQEDIPYKYILEVVNVYQESFNEVSNQDFDPTEFHLNLAYSFKKFDELKGWGNSEGK